MKMDFYEYAHLEQQFKISKIQSFESALHPHEIHPPWKK